jgi:NAD(P)H-nitrite reductase large subunit
MNDNTVICRCEEVTYGEIKEAVEFGLTSAAEVRKYTRTGMGSCQGRTCRHLLTQILKQNHGEVSVEYLPHIRAPVQPASIIELCTYEEES